MITRLRWLNTLNNKIPIVCVRREKETDRDTFFCEENTTRRKWKLVSAELLNLQESGQFPDESVNNVMFIIRGKVRVKEKTYKEVG